ncbi:MAG: galactitol-1-phosphate 5-dehydrogenase [Verrucomicrobia bacterium]|nr:galactitol-1-phosphate 5-dehydrogenase [Verrucomicrobiota bacterium]
MKALVLKTYKQFTCEDVPVPEFGPDEALIAVKVCGICGSDVHGMDGSTGRRRPPIIMGHEAAGVIAKTGGAVTGWKPGDRVTFDSTIYCGQCDFCHAGRINLCSNRRVLGVSCDEYRQDGAFAEFVAVPARILYRLPDALSFEHAALVEPLSIALHATRIAQVSRGQAAVVIGAGIIGLMLVQALRAAACEQIIVVDVAPERLAMAAQLGATATINSANADAPAEILWLTNNRGADLAFEAVGITATVDLAVRSVRKGGAVTLVGNVTPKVELPLQVAVARELTIRGSCASSGEYADCLDLLARGTVQASPLISAVAPLAEGAAWFERLYRKEPGLMKIILKPGE